MRRPRVLVTRAAEDAGEILSLLRERGIEPVLLPLLAVEATWRQSELEAALESVRPRLVLVTSRRAVDPLLAIGKELREAGVAVATVGESSALRAHDAGLQVLAHADHAAELLDRLAEAGPGLGPILWLRGNRALDTLRRGLLDLGHELHELVVYRTILLRPKPEDLAQALRGLDAACFTSPTTVAALLLAVSREWLHRHQVRLIAIALGPTTREALFSAGFRRIRTASEPSAPALVDAALSALRDFGVA
jgi:uroporphyrinogen-III synthase